MITRQMIMAKRTRTKNHKILVKPIDTNFDSTQDPSLSKNFAGVGIISASLNSRVELLKMREKGEFLGKTNDVVTPCNGSPVIRKVPQCFP